MLWINRRIIVIYVLQNVKLNRLFKYCQRDNDIIFFIIYILQISMSLLLISVILLLILLCILTYISRVSPNHKRISFYQLDTYTFNQHITSHNIPPSPNNYFDHRLSKPKNQFVIQDPFQHQSVTNISQTKKKSTNEYISCKSNKHMHKRAHQQLKFANAGLKAMKSINKRIAKESYYILLSLLEKERALYRSLRKKEKLNFVSTKLSTVYENIQYY